MGQAVLVGADVEDGGRLVGELQDRGVPVTAAVWAYNSNLEEWRLVIATPTPSSSPPSKLYKQVQDILARLDLQLPLSRIMLIRDDDPAVRNLQAVVESDRRDEATVAIHEFELAGRPMSQGRAYRAEVLQYEKQLFDALQRYQPADMILRHANRIGWHDVGVDFVMDDGTRLIGIEAKARRRPLALDDVHRAAGTYEDLRATWPRLVALLLVSRSGFSPRAESWQTRHEFPMLVTWATRDDDPALHRALDHALHRD